jgi:molybdopterin-guanine dinucleotide biosynthesis protein A
MNVDPMVTAIVLAGGRSSRFGADKLAAEVGGTAVLALTIDALAGLADRVVVAGPAIPEDLAIDVPVTLVADRAEFEGPLVALANVLDRAAPELHDLAIVVAGDMPRPVRAVLVVMLDALDVDPTIDAVLLGSSAGRVLGRRQVLPLAIRVAAARVAAVGAVEAGERSLQAFVDRLAHAELPFDRGRALDPDARTLADIDTPADLDRLNAP